MSDLKLDLEHDLDVSGTDLQLVTDIDEIAQYLKIRLLFIRGEWFLDITLGVPYYEDIWIKNPNLANIDAILQAEILGTPGVTALVEYNSNFISSQRKLEVSFTADTDNGQIQLTEIL